MICEKCGSTIPDGAKFCGECGAAVIAETPAQQTEVLAEPTAPSVQEEAPVLLTEAPAETPEPLPVPAEAEPAAPKKSHAGLVIALIAAAVIVLGVLIAGFLTNWFRAEKKQGPMDEIKAICEATFPEGTDNGTAMIHAGYSGLSFDIPMQFDFDRENPENSALYATIAFFGQEIGFGMYQQKLIISMDDRVQVVDLKGYENSNPGISMIAMKDKDGNYATEQYFRDLLPEEEFEQAAEEMDFDRLDQALQELEDNFNDEAWLAKFCGYTREAEDDTVTYRFAMTEELSDEVYRIISPAYKGEEPMDEIEFGVDDLKLEFVSVKGKLDELSIELEFEDEPIDLNISFSEIGKTEVDRDALQALLDSESEIEW